LIHAIFLGKQATSNKQQATRDVSWVMLVSPLILAVLCIVFGIFAYVIPLKYFIVPALHGNLEIIGMWPSLKAALFLVIGLGAGFLVYLLGNFKGVRETPPYIGGEELKEDMRLSGTEFYNTVRETGVLKSIYEKAERGIFDIYEQGKNLVFGIGRVFQYLHNGILPTYMVWMLLGMIGLFLFLMR
jgi:NADH:ubiquinone oxidoreductase subunit 5 (subunit L)/multisubunit Na+/H+ antiporter MnhA subunit